MPSIAHAFTARKADYVSPTHRVSVSPYINTDSVFHKSEIDIMQTFAGPPETSGTRFYVLFERDMAGAEGLEPPTCGFGDRRSTN